MLASEMYAFSDEFDYAVSVKLLFKAVGIGVPICLFTNSKSIFSTITDSWRLREVRLKNVISEIGRAYRNNGIDNVAWSRSEQNVAETLTRLNGKEMLINKMRTGNLIFTTRKCACKEDIVFGSNQSQKHLCFVEQWKRKKERMLFNWLNILTLFGDIYFCSALRLSPCGP